MAIRFDASLPTFTAILADRFGSEMLSRIAVIRDASGRLSAVLPEPVDSDTLDAVTTEIHQKLESYARSDSVIRDSNAVGAQRLLEEATKAPPMMVNGVVIRLLDRRFVGPDWLRPPAPTVAGIPRIVFASLKGGVGRSTALCVMAAHLSRRGRRVLVVDFDLEAPGLGTMLLNQDELPEYGVLDYLVENGLSGTDSGFIADMAGGSFLGSEGGRVTVIPAIGKVTFDNPSGALSKIARAYLDKLLSNGVAATLSDQLRTMIEKLEETGAFDVVLVDARAGLHETTPAAILGLGAEVLLFGTDQPQTFLGYRLLMSHLSRFPADVDDDWRERLNFVHAKASENEDVRARARERFSSLYDIIAPSSQQGDQGIEPLTADDFDVYWDENSDEEIDGGFAAPPILHVLDDSRYRDFDPIADRTLLSSKACAVTYESLLDYIERVVFGSEAKSP